MTLLILVKCTDGYVLAADRAQSENVVSSKEVQKIHKIGDTTVAFAGRVAIIEKSIKLIEAHADNGPFDIMKVESSLMEMMRYYKTKETDIALDGLVITKGNTGYVAFRVESDGMCYPITSIPYESVGAGVFQANPLLNQRLSRVMPIDRTLVAVYSVIQDVSRFNPSVEGPPSIYVFEGDTCQELDEVALGACKNEVEFQNEFVKMFHNVLNENDPTKIGKATDLLKSFEKEETPSPEEVHPDASPQPEQPTPTPKESAASSSSS